MGLAFFGVIDSTKKKNHANGLKILLGACLIEAIPPLIFHAEVRYVQSIAAFLVILSAYGFTYFPVRKKMVLSLTVILTICIYVSYLILFKNISNCGPV
jgi:hypothetical protein